MPPAFVKLPPAYTSVPDTAKACTVLSIPDPSTVQFLPSHLAMYLAEMPPAVVKVPPAYRSLLDATSATTEPFTPAPSEDQLASLKVGSPLCARISISGKRSSTPRCAPGA